MIKENEVSLPEELGKARERLPAARQVTERVLQEAGEALRWEMREWERRTDEQRRVTNDVFGCHIYFWEFLLAKVLARCDRYKID